MNGNDRALLRQVSDLVTKERKMREHLWSRQDPDPVSDSAALHHIEEELDQCWDLLRQRRALQAVHRDPGEARVRPVSQVENYLPRGAERGPGTD